MDEGPQGKVKVGMPLKVWIEDLKEKIETVVQEERCEGVSIEGGTHEVVGLQCASSVGPKQTRVSRGFWLINQGHARRYRCLLRELFPGVAELHSSSCKSLWKRFASVAFIL